MEDLNEIKQMSITQIIPYAIFGDLARYQQLKEKMLKELENILHVHNLEQARENEFVLDFHSNPPLLWKDKNGKEFRVKDTVIVYLNFYATQK